LDRDKEDIYEVVTYAVVLLFALLG
jgi:hypothetical protein